jgi:hypothetical protein
MKKYLRFMLKCVPFWLLLWLSSAVPVLPDSSPETWFAEQLVRSIDRQGGVQELARQVFGMFNKRAIGNDPSLPSVQISPNGNDCWAVLKAEITDVNDIGRKWDGSIDPSAPTGVALAIKLDGLVADSTHIEPSPHLNKNELQVEIDYSGKEYGWLIKCGGSAQWQMPQVIRHIGCDAITGTNPFLRIFLTLPKIQFAIYEQDRASAVSSLKSLYSKCHK